MYWLKLWFAPVPRAKVPDSSECSKLVKNSNVDRKGASQHGLDNPLTAKGCSLSSRFSPIRNHGRKYLNQLLKFSIRKTVGSNRFSAALRLLACLKFHSTPSRSLIRQIREIHPPFASHNVCYTTNQDVGVLSGISKSLKMLLSASFLPVVHLQSGTFYNILASSRGVLTDFFQFVICANSTLCQ